MLHTFNFEIAIPKEFLRSDGFFTKQTSFYDYKYKVTVQYSTDAIGSKFDIDTISCGALVVRCINWSLELEDYFLSAAKNNWESLNDTKEEVKQNAEILN